MPFPTQVTGRPGLGNQVASHWGVSSLLNTGGRRPPYPSPKVPLQSWADQAVPLPSAHVADGTPQERPSKHTVATQPAQACGSCHRRCSSSTAWSWATTKGQRTECLQQQLQGFQRGPSKLAGDPDRRDQNLPHPADLERLTLVFSLCHFKDMRTEKLVSIAHPVNEWIQVTLSQGDLLHLISSFVRWKS